MTHIQVGEKEGTQKRAFLISFPAVHHPILDFIVWGKRRSTPTVLLFCV